MATQSDATPNSVDKKPQNSVSQVTQPTIDNQNAEAEAKKDISPTSVLVNSEPIREEQVQNAVKFLSHPSVRGSPVIQRRSFLERKGLTKEEIDESFRRVPDPIPSVTTAQQIATSHNGQIKPSSSAQQNALIQTLQPAPTGSISTIGRLSRFHWSHALLAVGFLAVSGAGTIVFFKKAIIPWLKSWIRKVVMEEEGSLLKKYNIKPSLAEEAAAAAKAAAGAAADVARTSQLMLISKTEEKRCFEELIGLINVQLHEMKLMSDAIHKLEDRTHGRIPVEGKDDQNRVSWTGSRQPYANGNVNVDPHPVRSSSPSTPVEPSAAPHPKSYLEIMAMIQRGEKPSNIREINDAPPNPNQPIPPPRLAPRPKPWEVGGQAQSTLTNVIQSQERAAGNGHKFGSSNAISNGRPAQRWQVPLAPSVYKPEAAAAIRQPMKSVLQKEQLTDEQSVAHPLNETDELQRITKLSESGGVLEVNGESNWLKSSEIQEEEEEDSLHVQT